MNGRGRAVGDPALLLRALRFSARAHRDQRRKNLDAAPYINHSIEVAYILAHAGGVTDEEVLAAALLHDTVEDTCVTPDTIEERFGARVRRIVEEVTEDEREPWWVRKRRQVEEAPALGPDARLVKLADKIANVHDVAHAPPAGWSPGRRRRYLDWTEEVVAGCRGTSEALEARYDEVLSEARRTVEE